MYRCLLVILSIVSSSLMAVENPYTIDKTYDSNLPKSFLQVAFSKAKGDILISGTVSDDFSSDTRIYLWKYNAVDNGMNYINSTSFGIASDLVSYINVEPLGEYNQNYYALSQSNYDGTTKLVRFTLAGNELSLSQEVEFLPSLGRYGSFIEQIQFVNNDTIVALHPNYDDTHTGKTSYDYSVCKLSVNGEIDSCERKKILADKSLISNSTYKLYRLEGRDEVIFSPERVGVNETKVEPKLYVLKWQSDINDFVVFQEIVIPERVDSSRFSGVEAIYTINDGKELIVGSDMLLNYRYSSEDNKFFLSKMKNSVSYPKEAIYLKSENYFIERSGRHSYVFDDEDKYFYKSSQVYAIADGWFQLTDDKKGFFVNLMSPNITTFTLSNPNPLIYKGGLPKGSVPAVQDVPLAINIKKHFLNGNNLVVTGFYTENIDERLIWDGEYIRGTFTNEDMFASGNLNDPTPASPIQVRVNIPPLSTELFYITPTNVNDAPILTAEIGIQYLEKDQEYYGGLPGIVIDPDREAVTYTYKNVPSGLMAREDGIFQGAVKTKGQYLMTVTATDPLGAQLTFDVTFIVNDTGEPEKSSEGGGGTMDFTLLMLLITLFFRRLKHN
ncbi:MULTISPECIES: putative Ig domain-containing protein [unclassified Shewanella]|uniref:putative Ig domain-containing protein n=1 Tax=unclassified Shewanella TaxID=196818 RepID=UPI0020059B0F|nr:MULTISPECIES: putative Ig domain-containing protein [unclassified Shewanella]MCK7635163.1 putative Ig domain-containing protein [Shewanella sp. JNE17]MCK7650360.1 putative Ig domain-containing protein [Shewanella sp. JNE8]MCK7658586.1 putative Ig domain-containing protein [Shewanella sp. JNE4-2]UPO30448.1 putative Ig domain-containing protein [Shewanella sp. JNE2]